MGCQSHIARLALGRSPFGAPLQDDNGELIMGPNVQRNTTRNYVQLFDAKGHPQNLDSETSMRRLIRAQNDALSTVGVVVRRASMNRSPWQTMSDEQKHLLLLDENVAGANYGLVESLLQGLATRWIVTLRRRILTYKSYVGLSVPQMILSEWNILGPRTFLLAGLPSAAIAGISHSLRDDILDDARSLSLLRPTSRLHLASIARVVRTQSLRILWFAIEYPFYAFSVLQSLCLIPVNATLHALDLVPFSAGSPIQLPNALPDYSTASLLSYAITLLCSPFVLAYMRDQFGKFLFARVYGLVRHLIVKPDRPDRISLQIARENAHIIPKTTTSGQGVGTTTKRRYYHPSAVMDAIKGVLPAIFWAWEMVLQPQRTSLAVELSPEIEEELVQRTSMYYRDLSLQNGDAHVDARLAPQTLRLMAIRSAFNDFNLDPDQAMVDILGLAIEMSYPDASDRSTSTPDPQDLGPNFQITADSTNNNDLRDRPQPPAPSNAHTAEYDRLEDAESSDNPSTPPPPSNQDGATGDASSQNAFDRPPPDQAFSQNAVPLETLLEPVLSATDDDPWRRPSTPIPGLLALDSPVANSPAPTSPLLGISRAASLPHTTPRPVRRATEVGEELRPRGVDAFATPDLSRNAQDEDQSLYRVTILSNHPAETLALNVSSIIKSALLLPFDMMFLRSLSQEFLSHGNGETGAAMANPLRLDIWPLDFPFHTKELGLSSWFHVLGNWSITIAMQGLVHFIIWNASAHFTLRLGRKFGWGSI